VKRIRRDLYQGTTTAFVWIKAIQPQKHRLDVNIKNTEMEHLAMKFYSSGEEREAPTLLGPLGTANFNYWRMWEVG
jgi:hypothetical protein